MIHFIKKWRLSALLAFALCSVTTPAIAEVYVCADSSGKRTIQDKPCGKNSSSTATYSTPSSKQTPSRSGSSDSKTNPYVHPLNQKYNARRTDKLSFRQLVNLCRSLKQRQLDLSADIERAPLAENETKHSGIFDMATEIVDHCAEVEPRYWAQGYASELPQN